MFVLVAIVTEAVRGNAKVFVPKLGRENFPIGTLKGRETSTLIVFENLSTKYLLFPAQKKLKYGERVVFVSFHTTVRMY